MRRMEPGRVRKIGTRRVLAAPDNGGRRAFLGYLQEILQRLGRYVESGRGESGEAAVCWRAVAVFARVAESGWWSRRPEVEVELQPVERQFLDKVRQDRKRCAASGVAVPGVRPSGTGDEVRLVLMTLEALEICVRMRDVAGMDGCLELLQSVARSRSGGSGRSA